jgi:hypothetical protein
MPLLAFLIGFYGYVLPGIINMMLMELYLQKRKSLLAFVFVLALLFEFIYCYYSLLFFNYFSKNTNLMLYLTVIGCLCTLLIGIWMLIGAHQATKQHSDNNYVSRGIISIIFHPQQIPFWLITFVQLKPLIKIDSAFLFALFNVIGCASIFMLYMFGGSRFIKYLNLKISTVKKAVSLLWIAISVISLFNIVLHNIIICKYF